MTIDHSLNIHALSLNVKSSQLMFSSDFNEALHGGGSDISSVSSISSSSIDGEAPLIDELTFV